MAKALKIAIIGDFNFTFNAHHATNLAVEHSASLLGIKVDNYWSRIYEAARMKPNKLLGYDGIWLAPGPYNDSVFLHEVIKIILDSQIPFLITGEGFKPFLEIIIDRYNLNPQKEKVISQNLSSPSQFEKVEVLPKSKSLQTLYHNMNRVELTNSRYSIYPHIMNALKDDIIDIEATNQFDEPEVISLKSAPFCVASMSLPQICSTRELPHPLISAFFNYIYNKNNQ